MANKISWNINKTEGLELIHVSIKKILKDNNCKISLNNLANKLKSINVNLHNMKKYNNLVKYIKIHYTSMIKFLDDYHNYGISTINNTIYITLLNDDGYIYNRITRDEEWILL